MKKRTFIPLLIIVVLLGTWFGLHFFTHLFDKNYKYYGYYDDIKGMQSSSPVYLKGVKVGKVGDIFIDDDHNVKVTFSIKKEVQLPVGTIANLASGDLTGIKSVALLLSDNTTYLQPGGTLQSGVDSSFVENFNAKVTPILHNGKTILRKADTGLSDFNQLIINGLGRRTQREISGFEKMLNGLSTTTKSLNGTLNSMHSGISKVANLTDNPAKVNSDINTAAISYEKKTKDVANADLKEEVKDLGVSLNKLSENFKEINKNKLLNDKKTYEDVNASIDSFHQDIKDYKKDPPSPIKIFSK